MSSTTPFDSEANADLLIACPECDLLMRKPELRNGEQWVCPRCHYGLHTERKAVVTRSLALVLTALALYVPANFLPIMYLSLLGRTTHETLWSGVVGLYRSGMEVVAVIVFLCSMAVPGLKLGCQLFVLLSIVARRGRRQGLYLYRVYHHLRDWGMLEVYLLGILVAMIKLNDMADLSLGIGLACFVALLLVQVWLELAMSAQQIWDALDRGDDARD